MINTYSCIIIDDEDYAIGLLSESLNELYGNIKILNTFNTWKGGLEALRTMRVDIVFLDISIGGKNGLDILKIVPALDSEIIFVTAYAEYALEAFKYSATGYIVKPVGDTELIKAVDKAIERLHNKKLATQHKGSGAQLNSKIGIPSGKGVSYFDIDDIIYFEAVNNYTKVVTKNTELMSSYNIGKFSSILEGNPFYHVHRSFIVNLNYVSRYEAIGAVIMSNKKEIPVSRNTKDEFLKLFTSLQSDII